MNIYFSFPPQFPHNHYCNTFVWSFVQCWPPSVRFTIITILLSRDFPARLCSTNPYRLLSCTLLPQVLWPLLSGCPKSKSCARIMSPPFWLGFFGDHSNHTSVNNIVYLECAERAQLPPYCPTLSWCSSLERISVSQMIWLFLQLAQHTSKSNST